MSRQFDTKKTSSFEIYGEEYRLIIPESVDDLMAALEVKNALESYLSGLMHDEDPGGYEKLLQEQTDLIQAFVDSLGEFDSSVLSDNVNFLAKKHGMRVGELEETIGVSAGYLSRTIKENSKKKISIDVVWKIARLFDKDMNTLIGRRLRNHQSNTDLLERFLDKLKDDTSECYLTWENEGGATTALKKRYIEMGFISKEEDNLMYNSHHLNPELSWMLSDNIVALEGFENNKDLVIIPYHDRDNQVGEFSSGYDFYLIWNGVDEDHMYHWEKMFYTVDDPFGILKDKAQELYETIKSGDSDAELTPKMHELVSNYLMKGRP